MLHFEAKLKILKSESFFARFDFVTFTTKVPLFFLSRYSGTSVQGNRREGKSAHMGNNFRSHFLSYFYISYRGISVYGKS